MTLPGLPPPAPDKPRHAVVIGAGLAGCSISFALARRGIKVTLLDAGASIASAASGNTRGVCRPHIIRSAGAINQFNQHAYRHTLERLDALKTGGFAPHYQLPGVLQLLQHVGDWPAFECGHPRQPSAGQSTGRRGPALCGIAFSHSRLGGRSQLLPGPCRCQRHCHTAYPLAPGRASRRTGRLTGALAIERQYPCR